MQTDTKLQPINSFRSTKEKFASTSNDIVILSLQYIGMLRLMVVHRAISKKVKMSRHTHFASTTLYTSQYKFDQTEAKFDRKMSYDWL